MSRAKQRGLGRCAAFWLTGLCMVGCGSNTPAVPGDGGQVSPDGGARDGGVVAMDGGPSPQDGGLGADGGSTDAGTCMLDAGAEFDAGAVPLPDCAGGSTVNGTSIQTFVFEGADGGTIAQPENLTDAGIVAVAPTGDGGFCTSRASGTAQGTFTVPNVPAGSYYLKRGTIYIATSSTTLDIGFATLGRPNVVVATNDQTGLNLNLTGLASWQSTDELQIFSPDANAAAYFIGNQDPNIAAGSMTLSNYFVSYFDFLPMDLIDMSHGDRVFITQLTSRMEGAVPYRGIGRAGNPSPFAAVDGQTTSVTASLAATTPAQVSLHWKRSTFEALRTSVSPRATSSFTSLYIDSQPGGLSRGRYANTPDLLIIDSATGTDDLILNNLGYSNPFPSSWALFGYAESDFTVDYTLPSTTTPRTVYGRIWYAADLASFSSGQIQATLSPVQGLTVNGRNAFDDQSGVTTTPTIQWTAPAIGTPTLYSVLVYRLYPRLSFDGCSLETARQSVASLLTTGLQITLPPNVMYPGQSYHLVVNAFSRPGVDASQQPFVLSLPEAGATALSGILAP
jgi:hypothetical protein